MRHIRIVALTLALLAAVGPVAGAGHAATSCEGTSTAPVTPVSAVSCSIEIPCPDSGPACVWELSVHASVSGVVTDARIVVNGPAGQRIAACQNAVLECSASAPFNLPAGGTSQVVCAMNALGLTPVLTCTATPVAHVG